MSWFGGFFLRDPQKNTHVPAGSLLLRDGNIGVWTTREGRTSEDVRIVSGDDRWIAVFGACGAGEADLLNFSIHNDEGEIGRWPGSYTIVLCDGCSVSVSTDIANARPIYTADTEYGVVWGSSSRELTSLIGGQINLPWLATTLPTPGIEPTPAFNSAFSEIKMVSAGHWLTINSDTTTFDQIPTWRRQCRTTIEASMKLAETLRAGISTRIYANKKITTDCSGGFDSTTLTLLTFNQIDNHDRLTAITLHPRGVTRGGDFDYVTELLAAQPKIQHR
jgi:asparagine synthetase B (glutamine-hydrolysing)